MKEISFLFLIFLLSNCSGNKVTADCTVPAPVAIFSNDIPEISAHSFAIKDFVAKEAISFSNGVKLEIFQSGCEKIVQEFLFDVPSDQIESKLHTQQAIRQLKFISSLGPKYMAFDQWAQAIQELEPAFFESDEVEVVPGFVVRLDRIKGKNSSRILVRLSQN